MLTPLELLDRWLAKGASLLLLVGAAGMLTGRYLRAFKD